MAAGGKAVPWECWGCASCDGGRVGAEKLQSFDEERLRTGEYKLLYPTAATAAGKYERFMGDGKDAKETPLDVLLRKYVGARHIN
jgi:hypothetical protein